MGLIISIVGAIAAIIYAWCAVITCGALVYSIVKCKSIPLYWALAVVAAVTFPFALHAPLPIAPHSDFKAIEYFSEGAFSKLYAVLTGGALCAGAFALFRDEALRLMSALTWGFFSAYVVRIALLIISYSIPAAPD